MVKIYTLFFACFITAKIFSQSTTDTVLVESYIETGWAPFEADVIWYDDDCRVTETDIYYRNGIRWDTIRRNLYVYDSEGRLFEFTRQRWSTSILSPGWENDYRNIYLYSDDGLADTVVWQSWAFSNNGYYWRNDTREIHQYNAENAIIYQAGDYYDESLQAWILRDRRSTSYDIYNRPLNSVSQLFKNNHWTNNVKTQNIYNGDSAVTYYYFWNTSTHEWEKSNRDYTNLLGYTNKVETSVQQFLSGNIWLNALKQINQYNTDSLIVTNIYQGWDGMQWVSSGRTKTSYYADNVVRRSSYDIYNSSTNSWEQADRTLYTNHGCAVSAEFIPADKNDVKTDAIARNGNGYSYIINTNVTGANRGYKLVLATGRPNKKLISTGKPLAAASNTSINIFPNPARNYFTVDIKDKGTSFITITNLSGKQVMQQSLKNGSQKINISTLATGFYVVSVTTNGQVINQKLLVE